MEARKAQDYSAKIAAMHKCYAEKNVFENSLKPGGEEVFSGGFLLMLRSLDLASRKSVDGLRRLDSDQFRINEDGFVGIEDLIAEIAKSVLEELKPQKDLMMDVSNCHKRLNECLVNVGPLPKDVYKEIFFEHLGKHIKVLGEDSLLIPLAKICCAISFVHESGDIEQIAMHLSPSGNLDFEKITENPRCEGVNAAHSIYDINIAKIFFVNNNFVVINELLKNPYGIVNNFKDLSPEMEYQITSSKDVESDGIIFDCLKYIGGMVMSVLGSGIFDREFWINSKPMEGFEIYDL